MLGGLQLPLAPDDTLGMVEDNNKGDKLLIEAAKGGDFDSFELLVERYRDRLYRLAYTMTRNTAEAEEVVQDAFLSIFKNLDSYRGESAPSTWIYRIASNAALMRLRTKRRKPLYSVEDHTSTALGGTAIWATGDWSRAPDEQLLGQELRDRLSDAVASLPEDYGIVLTMRDVEGLSNAEVGEALGLSLAAVKSRLHRARLVVRSAIERYFESSDVAEQGAG